MSAIMSVTLLCKLIAGPLLIAMVTWISRCWGAAAGGWCTGLPLTSGPVSIFLALEQGRDYACAAAVTSLAGGSTVTVFCLVWALAAARFPLGRTVLYSLAAYTAFTLILASFTFTVWTALLLMLVTQCVCLHLVGPDSETAPSALPAPWWDIPVRMSATAGITLGITALAHTMGPEAVGLLAPFPAIVCILSFFLQLESGYDSLHRYLRGVITANFGLLGFFASTALLLSHPPHLPLPLIYLAALAVALLTDILVLRATHASTATTRAAPRTSSARSVDSSGTDKLA